MRRNPARRGKKGIIAERVFERTNEAKGRDHKERTVKELTCAWTRNHSGRTKTPDIIAWRKLKQVQIQLRRTAVDDQKTWKVIKGRIKSETVRKRQRQQANWSTERQGEVTAGEGWAHCQTLRQTEERKLEKGERDQITRDLIRWNSSKVARCWKVSKRNYTCPREHKWKKCLR